MMLRRCLILTALYRDASIAVSKQTLLLQAALFETAVTEMWFSRN